MSTGGNRNPAEASVRAVERHDQAAGVPYYSTVNSEGSGFLNPADSVVLRDANIYRYRTSPWPAWVAPLYKSIRRNMGRELGAFDLSADYHGLYLSPVAHEVLAPFLSQGGEMLPIVTDEGEAWHLFLMSHFGPFAPLAEITAKDVIRRNHTDMPKPLPRTPKAGLMPWQRLKGRADYVSWYEFEETTVAGRHVFRAQHGGKFQTPIFVSHAFMRAATENGLKGLDYRVTVRPEGPFWHSDPHDKDFPFWY